MTVQAHMCVTVCIHVIDSIYCIFTVSNRLLPITGLRLQGHSYGEDIDSYGGRRLELQGDPGGKLL